MTDQPTDPDRARFLAACQSLLGDYYAASTDRELAIAAISVASARTSHGLPMDAALRAFVCAIAPMALSGAVSLRAVKRSALEQALSVGPAILAVDATCDGVDVPGYLRQKDLKLRLGYGLRPPIPDLELDESGWRATLIFRGEPHACFVPWEAVWAVGSEVTREGVVWAESAPEGWQPAEQKNAERVAAKAAPESAKVHGQRPKLGLVPLPDPGPEDEDYERVDKTVPELGPPTRHDGRPIELCAMAGCDQCSRAERAAAILKDDSEPCA